MSTAHVLEDLRSQADTAGEAAAVAALLRDRTVTPLFQPIVDLTGGAVVAVEALARGPAGSRLERPDQLFAAAHRAGLLGPVDMLCAERALECAIAGPVVPPLVFVNAEPSVLSQPISARLLELLTGGLPFRVVLEYTERALSTVPAALLRIAGMAHRMGNGIALDDVGADPMSLAILPFVDPDVIKLDMHLLRNPTAPATAQVCAAVTAAARRTGAIVIAEGIETAADVATARSLGADWGQGWHFGRPAPLAELHLPVIDRAPALRASRPGLHQPSGSPFEVAVAGGAHRVEREAARRTMERMCVAAESHQHAVVLGSYCSADDVAAWRPSTERLTRHATLTAMVRPDGAVDPFPDESCVLVVTPEFAAAVCWNAQSRTLARTEDREVVASIGRVLLQRLNP
ncbi:EAL domain-containing protein [Actinoplanes sp. NPDC024001]|uniref:EAL domain-containing protein n=1 Tax=Actinoplanes sp. NPDC024001 TaxID=3154598 RepID=UPI0033F4F588